MNKIMSIRKEVLSKAKALWLRVLGRQDSRVVVANWIYLSVLQASNFLISLMTIPHQVSTIGASGLGKIAFANALFLWVGCVSDWGFNYTATRDLAQKREDLEESSRILSTVLYARALLGLVALLVLAVLVLSVPKLKENADVIWATMLMLPGQILFPEWFYQALERMKYITILGFLSKVTLAVSIFVFVQDETDYVLPPLLEAMGALLAGAISVYLIFYKWGFRLCPVSWHDIFHAIKGSTDLFINSLLPNFWNSFSTLLLGFVAGDVANGIYDAGRKFVLTATRLLSTVHRAVFPLLARKLNAHYYYMLTTVGIAAVAMLSLWVLAPFLIDMFYGTPFVDSVLILRIFSITLISSALINIYGVNYLLHLRKEHLIRKNMIISSAFGFASALILINLYQVWGAVTTVTATSVLHALLLYYTHRRVRSHQIRQ